MQEKHITSLTIIAVLCGCTGTEEVSDKSAHHTDDGALANDYVGLRPTFHEDSITLRLPDESAIHLTTSFVGDDTAAGLLSPIGSPHESDQRFDAQFGPPLAEYGATRYREFWSADARHLRQWWVVDSLGEDSYPTLEIGVEIAGVDSATSTGATSATLSVKDSGYVVSISGLAAFDAMGSLLPIELDVSDPEQLIYRIDVEGAALPVLIDPVYTSGTTLTGSSTGNFGDAVSEAGDTNGDGYDDVVVSDNWRGYIYVYYGSSTGISTSGRRSLYRPSSSCTYYGFDVSSAGDTNGDGYGDIIVSGLFCSSAFVYYGSSSGLSSTPTTLSPSGAPAWFGYSVAGAGDVNGDGYDDVLVGAGASGAYLFKGRSSGVSTTALASFTTVGGYDVAGIGDVNSDGYDEIAVADYTYSSASGVVRIYHGRSSGPSTTASRTLTGASTGDAFGYSIAGAGDVNADGYDDVVIGARNASTYGRAYIYRGSSSGISSSVTTTLSGSSSVSNFGTEVSDAGDVNNDGYGDIIVGTDSNRAYVYQGRSTGVSTSVSTTLSPSGTTSGYGSAVSTAGDVDSDGHDDVIVGNSFSYKAYVYEGY